MERAVRNVLVGLVGVPVTVQLAWTALAVPDSRPQAALALAALPVFWLVPALAEFDDLLAFWLLYLLGFTTLTVAQQDLSLSGAIGPHTAPLVLVSPLPVLALCALLWKKTWHPSNAKRTALVAGLVLLGLGVAFFSGPQGGPGRFMAFLRETMGLTPAAADAVNFVVRKSVHIVAYGLMALCASRVAWGSGASPRRSVAAGVAWGLLHAVYDESAQSQATGRSGSAWDVALDFAGMALFLVPQVLAARREAR